jgi:hypothetical protein
MKPLFYIIILSTLIYVGCKIKQHEYEIKVTKSAENGFLNLLPCEVLINGKPIGSIKSGETNQYLISKSNCFLSVRSPRWEPDAQGGVDFDTDKKEVIIYSNIEPLESNTQLVYVISAVRSGVGNCCDHIGWKITKANIPTSK